MAVHHEVALPRAGPARGFRQHDGVAVGRTEARVEADLFAMFDEPSGACGQVLAMPRLRGDARVADVLAEFVHEPLLMTIQIIQDNIHAREYRETEFKAKQIEAFRTPACAS